MTFNRIINKVIFLMKKDNCRVMDSDILKALKSAKYDMDKHQEIINITISTEHLVKN